MRKFVALAGALALATISLTSCSADSSNNLDPANAAFDGVKQTCATYETGKSADLINLDSATPPKASFPVPLNSKAIETKVIKEGTGPKFTGDELVDIEFQLYNGGTGDLIQSSKFDGTDFASQFLKSGGSPDFCHALAGVRQGSTVAALFPAKLAHNNQGVSSLGVGAQDSIVFVFKLLKVFLPRANGETQLPQDGFPQVVLAKSGAPGLVMQDWTKPAFDQFKKATLIQGKGDVVKEGQVVTVHYSGWVWSDAKNKFDSSWDKGQPVQFTVAKGQVIDGFVKALVGEKVGSQVIAVIPPAEGYGAAAQGSIPANSTLIFVVDILGAN
ncbi:MAG: FKBP-type peptidyl-prolyl cis-trans isomerase [Micrococcales bacterium]